MKTFLLTLLVSINVFAQINFNTQFPKIGYFDPFTTMMSPLYYGTSNPQNWPNYATDSYYYPALSSLGLTHIVTFAGSYNWITGSIGAIPLSSYNPTLKVMDLYFTMRLSRYDSQNPMFSGGVYAAAQGNTKLFEYYQVGGSTCTYDQSSNYGFGTTTQTSVWVTNPPVIGLSTQDPNNPSFYVFYANVNWTPRGILLQADLPSNQQARKPAVSGLDPVQYLLKLNARIDGWTNPNDQDTVAIVKIFDSAITQNQVRI